MHGLHKLNAFFLGMPPRKQGRRAGISMLFSLVLPLIMVFGTTAAWGQLIHNEPPPLMTRQRLVPSSRPVIRLQSNPPVKLLPLFKNLTRQNANGSTAIEKKGTAVGADGQETIDEINSIRDRIGASVADQFDGLFAESDSDAPHPDDQSQQDFDQELHRLVAQDDSISNPLQSRPRFPATATTAPRDHSMEKPTTIRRAARLLELAAAELEEAHCFTEADGLRDQARRLWRRAR